MKRRSITNSRPAEDLDFRQAYMDRVFYDELLPYFPQAAWPGDVEVPGYAQRLSMHGTDACDPHHAFGGRMGRWDRPWNVVMVCRPVHEFVERYKDDGRVLVIRRKLDAGLWDEADAYRCLGFYPLGLIQGVTCQHKFAETIRREIVRQIELGNIKTLGDQRQ